MWKELLKSRGVSAFLCLCASLLVGLGAARYLALHEWASQTMAGAFVAGFVFAYLAWSHKPAGFPAAASAPFVDEAPPDSAGEDPHAAPKNPPEGSLEDAIGELKAALVSAAPENRLLAVSLAGLLFEIEHRRKLRRDFKGASNARKTAEALLSSHSWPGSANPARNNAGYPGVGTYRGVLNRASSMKANLARGVRRSTVHWRGALQARLSASAPTVRQASRSTWLVIGLCAVILVLSFGILRSVPAKPRSPVVSPDVLVRLDLVPSAAIAEIDGKKVAGESVPLRKGTHSIKLSLAGYDPVNDVLNVASEPFVYRKALTAMRLRVDFQTGMDRVTTTLDRSPFVDGILVPPNENAYHFVARLAKGSFAKGGIGEIPITFSAHAAAPPDIQPVPVGGAQVVAVTSFGRRAAVYTNRKNLDIRLNGVSMGKASSAGLMLDLPNSAETTLSIGDGKQKRELSLNDGDPPRLRIILDPDETIAPDKDTAVQAQDAAGGSILVLTDRTDVQISVDGQPVKGSLRGGKLVVPSVKPGDHTLRIAKEGYCASPEEFGVTLTGTEQAQASFRLRALPSLRIVGRPQNSRITIDGTEWPGADFPMKMSSHSVKVTAMGFEDFSKTVEPSCGSNITLNLASEMTRARPPEIRPAVTARVGFSVEPANATVTLLRFDGTPVFGHPVASPLDVEPGAYKLHASLSGYADGDFQFIVHAGQDIPGIALRLVASAKPIPLPWSPPLAASKQGWEKVAKLSLYGTEKASGTYEFRLQRRGSIVHKSFSSWIVGYRAGDYYVEFRVDGQDLQWRKSGGAWNTLGSVEIPNKAAEIYVSVTIQKGAVTTAVGDTPQSAVPVGEALSLPEGLFGLARDTAIRGFHHSP